VKDIDTWGDYAPPHLPASQVGREIRREKR